MKCTIFAGEWFEAQAAFNNWAEGKDLTREVIIHEQVLPPSDIHKYTRMLIIVYHPDTPAWNSTKEIIYSKAMVEQHIEGHQSAQEIPT